MLSKGAQKSEPPKKTLPEKNLLKITLKEDEFFLNKHQVVLSNTDAIYN